MSAGGGDRLRISGVRVPRDAEARIARQDALELGGSLRRSIGDGNHARMNGVTDADATAVVHGDPGRAG